MITGFADDPALNSTPFQGYALDWSQDNGTTWKTQGIEVEGRSGAKGYMTVDNGTLGLLRLDSLKPGSVLLRLRSYDMTDTATDTLRYVVGTASVQAQTVLPKLLMQGLADTARFPGDTLTVRYGLWGDSTQQAIPYDMDLEIRDLAAQGTPIRTFTRDNVSYAIQSGALGAITLDSAGVYITTTNGTDYTLAVKTTSLLDTMQFAFSVLGQMTMLDSGNASIRASLDPYGNSLTWNSSGHVGVDSIKLHVAGSQAFISVSRLVVGGVLRYSPLAVDTIAKDSLVPDTLLNMISKAPIWIGSDKKHLRSMVISLANAAAPISWHGDPAVGFGVVPPGAYEFRLRAASQPVLVCGSSRHREYFGHRSSN